MTQQYPHIAVDTNNPDPTRAINAFLWCMAKARELGMSPPSEHTLAEHLFRKDARIVFYSSMSGIISIVMDESAEDETGHEEIFNLVMSVLARRRDRRRAAKEATASAIEARSGETADAGSTEGESATGNAGDAQTPAASNKGGRDGE